MQLAKSMSEAKPSPPLKPRSNKRFASKKKEQDKQRAYRKNKLFRRIEADIKERDRRRIPGKRKLFLFYLQNLKTVQHFHTRKI